MRPAGLLLVGCLLAGCVAPPREAPPGALIEPQALGLDADTALPAIAVDWWTAFGDPQLDALMAEALGDSPTLAQAMARVRLALSRVQADIAANRPQTALDADASWERLSENFYIPPPWAGDTMWIGQVTANLRWDLDVWGRQAALIRESRSQVMASTLDVAAARLALAGAVATAYVDLYRSWELVDIATQAQQQREQVLELTRQRTAAGLGTQIELKVAESGVPPARAFRRTAEAARDMARHRLAALVGAGPDRYARFSRPALSLEAALPIPERLPVDLLAHRPDVLAARARVEAATAGRTAARAAFYPNVSLTAFVGTQAIDLGDLADSGSRVYGVGPALHLPIFDAQRLKAGYAGAAAELDAATAAYDSAVLEAVREAADQLTQDASMTQQTADGEAALLAASRAHELAGRRYTAGLTTRIAVLDAESRVLDARRQLLAARSGGVLARMNLLLALGGSFDPASPPAAAHAGAPP